MPNQLVLLYGPPASGKDTITRALEAADSRYRLFRRMKYGPGRTTGYRLIGLEDLAAVRSAPGEVIWENERYGAVYIIDRSELLRMFTDDLVPVLHLGQPEIIPAVVKAFPEADILVVGLECARDVAFERARARRTGDVQARMAAYDATSRLPSADLRIDTGAVPPETSAELIRQAALRHAAAGAQR